VLAGENASLPERQCPLCRGPMQVIRMESGIPGLPPGRQRQMMKCSVCGLVNSILQQEDDRTI
jgi:hypothetical protein